MKGKYNMLVMLVRKLLIAIYLIFLYFIFLSEALFKFYLFLQKVLIYLINSAVITAALPVKADHPEHAAAGEKVVKVHTSIPDNDRLSFAFSYNHHLNISNVIKVVS